MEKINFTNGQAPAINGANLNQLQANAETSINEVANTLKDYITSVTYTSASLEVAASGSSNTEIATSVPTGYSLLGYIIMGNGWNGGVLTSVIKADDTKCVVNAYNALTSAKTITITIKGLYVKNQ